MDKCDMYKLAVLMQKLALQCGREQIETHFGPFADLASEAGSIADRHASCGSHVCEPWHTAEKE